MRPPNRPTSMNDRGISRRSLLKGTGGVAAALALSGHALPAVSQEAETALDLVVWTFGIDIVQNNIDIFEEATPGISVALSDFSWNAYHETMVNRFRSN